MSHGFNSAIVGKKLPNRNTFFFQIFKVYCNNNMGKDSKRFQIDQNNLTPILRHSLQLELQHLRDLRGEREYFRHDENYLKNW